MVTKFSFSFSFYLR